MKVTFLLPSYVWAPSGGPKVVYEYANRLREEDMRSLWFIRAGWHIRHPQKILIPTDGRRINTSVSGKLFERRL